MAFSLSRYVARSGSCYRNFQINAFLGRNASIPSRLNFSMCGWFCQRSNTATNAGLFQLEDPVGGTEVHGLELNADGITLGVTNGSIFQTFPSSPGLNRPYFGAYNVAADGSITGYWRFAESKSLITSGALVQSKLNTVTDVAIGSFAYDPTFIADMQFWNIRCWQGFLTAQQLMAESLNSTPVLYQNLWAWWPLEGTANRLLLDHSGYNRHLTQTVSGRVEQNPFPRGSTRIHLPKRSAVPIRARVQQMVVGTDSGGASSSVCTATLTVKAGSSIHFFATMDSSTGDFTGISSSPVMTWTLLDNTDNGVHAQRAAHWVANNAVAGSITVTATCASGTFRGAVAKEITGTSGYDAAATAAHHGATQDGPGLGTDALSSGNTSALSTQPALLSGFCCDISGGGSATASLGFIDDGVVASALPVRGESKRLTALTAVAATFTATVGTDSFISLVAVFKETPTFVPVTYDTSSVNATGTGVTVSQSITVANNFNRLLLAFINTSDGGVERTVTSVAYTAGSGSPWSLVGVENADGITRKTEVWASIGPSVGSCTVQANFDNAPAAGSCLALVSVYNALQTNVAEAVNYTEENNGNVVSLAVTTPTNGLAVVNVTGASALGAITSGTEILNYTGNDFYRVGIGSTPPTTTISWTTAASGRGLAGVNVNPIGTVVGGGGGGGGGTSPIAWTTA
jgi:hypothetical protein